MMISLSSSRETKEDAGLSSFPMVAGTAKPKEYRCGRSPAPARCHAQGQRCEMTDMVSSATPRHRQGSGSMRCGHLLFRIFCSVLVPGGLVKPGRFSGSDDRDRGGWVACPHP